MKNKEDTEKITKKKKKSKKIDDRKNIEVDPERWLPMTQRSYYKKSYSFNFFNIFLILNQKACFFT